MSTELTERLLIPDDVYDIAFLNTHHQQLASSGGINKDDAIKVMNVLGGIDDILRNYIQITQRSVSSNEELLSKNQIQQICKILCSQEEVSSTNNNDKVVRYFQKRDTFLYSLFEAKTAYKITKLLWNKCVIAMFSIITIAWYFPAVAFRSIYTMEIFFILEVIYFTMLGMYFAFIILSSHREIFCKILRRFDFWLKLYYCIKIIVLSWVYYPSVDLYTKQEYGFFLFARVVATLIIIYFSSIDGFDVSWKSIILLGIGLSILFTVDSLRWTFDGRPDFTFNIYRNISVSLTAEISSATRILAIFLWKQVFQILIKRGSESILIRIYPKIQWIEKCNDTNINLQGYNK